MTPRARAGVLLMTYGSPASLERQDVHAYLARVRGGREPAEALVDEFTRRYRVIGGSPLIAITREQGHALAERLGWPVAIGMRFSEPSIAAGLRALVEAGVDHVTGIVLSPQYSTLLMGSYARAVADAQAMLDDDAVRVAMAGPWYDDPAFVAALAGRVTAALARIPPSDRGAVTVLMTAHSLPKRVADQEPSYLAQLRDTAEAVAARAGLDDRRWRFCWQSAGHEPGEWMKPDFADVMPELTAAGCRSVVVAPVQFLADHLEVLYDIDVAARQQAERCGLDFQRIDSLNVDPGLVEALASVACRTVREGAGADS